MGLTTKDTNKKKIPSTYPEDHELFSFYNEKYRWYNPKHNADGSAKTKAQSIAFSLSEQDLEKLINRHGVIKDKDIISYLKKLDIFEILTNQPNYFLTLSMPTDYQWVNYNRNYHVARLYKTSAVLFYKLMIRYDSSLKQTKFEQWPFFIGRMEHFDSDGKMVAPHLHFLFKSEESLQILLSAIKELWGSVVTDAGPSGIDLQIIPAEQLESKANYILKYAHQDNLPTLNNGVDPYDISRYAMWDQESIATDRWLLDRTTLRKALKERLPIISENSPLSGLPKIAKQKIRKMVSGIDQLSDNSRINQD